MTIGVNFEVSSHPAHGEVYSKQHYVLKFVNDMRQFGCFLLLFPPIHQKQKK